MSGIERRAVFVSYASQDAEAAKRICETLRAAGVEVWFDQNELVGGDAWDAKIRRQIAACELFVPIISANTQARLEGYFRIEWKLAAQRTHGMADERAFLLPVVIDETRDADARVPAEFKAVQWTRLPLSRPEGDPAASGLAAFSARISRLVDSEMMPASESPAAPVPVARRRAALGGWRAVTVVTCAIGVLAAGWWLHRTLGSAAPRNPELAKAAALFDFNSSDTPAENFALAEDILKTQLAAHPADPDAVILYAWLNDLFNIRGFDVSEPRRDLARRYTERAVQLAPHNADAIAARGIFYLNTDPARAEQLLREAIAINARDPRSYRMLSFALFDQNKRDEALANARHALALFPKEPLVHYDFGLVQLYAAEWAGSEQAFVETLPLTPRTTLLNAGIHADLAAFAAFAHGDLVRMKGWLDRMPEEFRDHDREAWPRFIYAFGSGEPQDALATLDRMPGTWLRNYGEIPKSLIAGDLLTLQGKSEKARIEYEAAQAEVARARAADPAKPKYRLLEIWVQIRLGQMEPARAALPGVVAAFDRVYFDPLYLAEYWYGPLAASLVLGDRETALGWLRRGATLRPWKEYYRNMMRIDPRAAKWRDDPQIAATLAPANPSRTDSGPAGTR